LFKVRSDSGDFCELRKDAHTHNTLGTRPPDALMNSGRQRLNIRSKSSPMTKTTQTRKHKAQHERPHPRDPTHFFVGRQRHPPYAWAYDDDEMRASNIMWIIDKVINDADLEKVYLEEITLAKSRGARVPRREMKGGGKRRKGLGGGIIDLSISDASEDEDHMDLVDSGRRESKFSLSNTGRSVESSSTSSISSSTFTSGPYSSQHTPTKKRTSIAAVEVKRSPELRAVFVSSLQGSSFLADVSGSEEGRQVDSICDGKALVVI